jgi:hypothetical protein
MGSSVSRAGLSQQSRIGPFFIVLVPIRNAWGTSFRIGQSVLSFGGIIVSTHLTMSSMLGTVTKCQFHTTRRTKKICNNRKAASLDVGKQ